MKIKVTKEQAMILENLKTQKVIKITEEQYRELLNLESNAYPSITSAFGKQAGEFKHNVSKLSKGMVYEESENIWKEFINELYGLNESGTNIYESLIKIMETVGYVKERKLCKEVFNNDKELAKEIISRGLYEFKESGSPYMAMEAMDNEHKKIIDSLKQQLTQKSTTKTSDEDIRKEIARRREIELNDRLKNRRGDISEIDGEESQEMTDEIDTINMDVPLFIRALEFSREDAKSDLTLHEITENAIRLSKEYGTLTMDNYYDIFGDDTQTNTDSVEEPNLTEYDDNLPMGTRYRKDAPWNEPDETEEPVNVNKDWDVLKFDEINNSIILKSRRNNNEYALNIDIIPDTLSDEINFSDINRTDWRSSLYGDRSKSIIANFVSDNLKGLVLPQNYGEGNPSDLFMDGKIFVKVIDTIDEVTDGSALGGTSLVIPLGSKPEDYIIKKGIKESLTKVVKESAFDKTQWAGGEFVEFDDCTKLNNNKEAQNGGCSTGAIDNVVKLKKSKSNVNAPSLKK